MALGAQLKATMELRKLNVRREGIRLVPAAERDHGGRHEWSGEGRRPQVHTDSAVRTIVYTTSGGSLTMLLLGA